VSVSAALEEAHVGDSSRSLLLELERGADLLVFEPACSRKTGRIRTDYQRVCAVVERDILHELVLLIPIGMVPRKRTKRLLVLAPANEESGGLADEPEKSELNDTRKHLEELHHGTPGQWSAARLLDHEAARLTQGRRQAQSPLRFRVPKQVHAAMIDPTAKGIKGRENLFSQSAAETIGGGTSSRTEPASVDQCGSLGSVSRMADLGNIRRGT
jgi:hypothetical protein